MARRGGRFQWEKVIPFFTPTDQGSHKMPVFTCNLCSSFKHAKHTTAMANHLLTTCPAREAYEQENGPLDLGKPANTETTPVAESTSTMQPPATQPQPNGMNNINEASSNSASSPVSSAEAMSTDPSPPQANHPRLLSPAFHFAPTMAPHLDITLTAMNNQLQALSNSLDNIRSIQAHVLEVQNIILAKLDDLSAERQREKDQQRDEQFRRIERQLNDLQRR
jgi:hypothetical protein